MNRYVRWTVLTCSVLFVLEQPAVSLARECQEIQAGWWHNLPVFGTKFSKQRFNECARKYRKKNWKMFDVSGPNCQSFRSNSLSHPQTAIDDCGGQGGDPGARFFCVTQATVCSPR